VNLVFLPFASGNLLTSATNKRDRCFSRMLESVVDKLDDSP
jgi:hypothetical protein